MPFPIADLALGGSEILVIGFAFACYVVLSVIPAILAYTVLSRVPAGHRKQSPVLALLLMIPVFSLVWMFFVHPKVAESLKSYFDSVGDKSARDCGASLAMALCISGVCSIIPVLGFFSIIVSLVMMILFYAKAFDLTHRIPKTV